MNLLTPLRWSPNSVIGVVMIGLTLAACGANGLNEPGPPTVVEVIDGDTVIIDFDGDHETVRLLGVDTPETVDPNRPVQCFGPEASQFLRSTLLPGSTVEVMRDVEARDRFGRLLVYLRRTSEETLINIELVRNGYGDVSIYDPNVAFREELEHALATAQTSGAGLWGACGGADVALDPPPPTATRG